MASWCSASVSVPSGRAAVSPLPVSIPATCAQPLGSPGHLYPGVCAGRFFPWSSSGRSLFPASSIREFQVPTLQPASLPTPFLLLQVQGVLVQVFVRYLFSAVVGICLGVELLDQVVALFTCLGGRHTGLHRLPLLPAMCEAPGFSTSSPALALA